MKTNLNAKYVTHVNYFLSIKICMKNIFYTKRRFPTSCTVQGKYEWLFR
jgi:hypothetical protein